MNFVQGEPLFKIEEGLGWLVVFIQLSYRNKTRYGTKYSIHNLIGVENLPIKAEGI